MVTNGRYKKILDAMPQGVFVFDNRLRVKFTNAAFKRSVLGGMQGHGHLAQAFYRVMQAAVEERTEKSETVHTSVNRNGHTDKVSTNIRVLPLDNKGKLFLGLTDGNYHTEIEREMLAAGQMQRRLLPAGKSVCGVNYAYMYIPRYGVGGDLPDVYELNGQTYGILCDVSGKGISAGMLSAFMKAAFDKQQPDLALALWQVNAKFNELNQDERSYITVSAVRIDKKAGLLRYAVAGHNVPILLRNALGINEIESPAPPISNWIQGYAYRENEIPIESGDLLVMCTDGVTECVNSAGEQFGIERVESVLMQSRGAEDFIAKLKSALSVFCGGNYTDDITAVAFDL